MSTSVPSTVAPVSTGWLVQLVNEYAAQARETAGESALPYPAVDTEETPAATELTEGELARLATELWPVFGSETVVERAKVLNHLLREAELMPVVSESGEAGWAIRKSTPRAILAAACVATLRTAVGSLGWDRLGICAAGDCVDVYIDDVGRTRRRYCSSTCLNRERVRAYRSRQQAR